MKNYRPGFLLAVVGNVFFAGVLAGWWWQSRAANRALKAEPQPADATVPASTDRKSVV
jgi:hypothetical protein